MADPAKRLKTNVPGDFFVDSTCIDCDACRWIAPSVFDRMKGKSRVFAQPADPSTERAALRALLACPTSSIGAGERQDASAVAKDFPIAIEGGVAWCGYHAASSFGATAYFIRRPPERGGNVLVDSPRFAGPLVERLEALGGVATMFITHVDDEADHARFAERFGCRRVMHAADVEGIEGLETLLEGEAPIRLDDELLAVPTPGHTRGSTCLLYKDRYLFTGDHLAWSDTRAQLYAFRDACWFDWETQIASMRKLTALTFAWVLPGHGRRVRLPEGTSAQALSRCIGWMRHGDVL
ncbi:MAG TPA: MBL fold metallo-hydrolase [Planctomycetota bacterium]|nr:MBL fold metallo-hydrolase [Planctomycetota bacterium]